MESALIKRLDSLVERSEDISDKLSAPEVAADAQRYRELSKAYADLSETVKLYREFQRLEKDLAEAGELAEGEDAEMAQLAREEVEVLEERVESLDRTLRLRLLPRDPNDERNVILEIRAGTGGDEAGLFAADLYRMYSRYGERRGWKIELLNASETGIGGVKEAVVALTGDRVYSRLKFESGVHRVQRVPSTETQGRIHTSAVTVAVLPEAEEVDVSIEEKDLRIDRFCSSGPGGQSVNTTYSAIRITHLPTGLVVSCQDEKSQIKNKARALKILRSRLLKLEQEKLDSERSSTRRSMVGSGDRSEKIRTYNFPQSRVTDHRISLTIHRLQDILDGDLDQVVGPLSDSFEAQRLEEEYSQVLAGD